MAEVVSRLTISRLHISANWKWCSQYFASFYFPIRCGVSCAQLLQLCPTLCKPVTVAITTPAGSSVHGILQARVGCHALLQVIFLTQGLNLCLLCLPALASGFFTTSTTWTAQCFLVKLYLWARVEDIKAHICEFSYSNWGGKQHHNGWTWG